MAHFYAFEHHYDQNIRDMCAFPTKVLVTYWEKEEGDWRKCRRLLDMGEQGVIVDVSRINDETHHIASVEFVYMEVSV